MRILAIALLLATGVVRADTVSDVKAATGKWLDAFNRKSVTDIVALYAKDAVFFGTSSPVLRDKPELVLDYFKTIPTLGDDVITVSDSRVQVYGKVAIHTGFYTRSSTREGPLVQSPARFTFVYEQRKGQWVLVNHHSSALPAPP